MDLHLLTAYLDSLLNISSIEDPAHNGLQVEAGTQVAKVGMAVDSCIDAFRLAAQKDIDLLIVHHGLFWDDQKLRAVTGLFGKRIETLMKGNVSLYSAHLPLDIHSELGNNIQFARQLGLKSKDWFGLFKNVNVALEAVVEEPITFDDFHNQVAKVLNVDPVFWKFGHSQLKSVGIATGKATFLIPEMAQRGIDVFLTGEPSHSAYHIAKEYQLNVVFGGHYATEVFGLKALSQHIQCKFNLEVSFLDFPTNL